MAICRSVASWKITYAGHALLLGRRRRARPAAARTPARPRPAAQASAAACPRRGRRGRDRRRSGSRRSSTVALAAQHLGARLGQRERAVVALAPRAGPGRAAAGPRRATRPRSARCRCRTTVSESWPNCVDLVRLLAEQDVDRAGPAPNRWLRSRCSRHDRGQQLLRRRPCRPRTPAASGRCRSCRTARRAAPK